MDIPAALLWIDTSSSQAPERKLIKQPIELSYMIPTLMNGWNLARSMRDVTITRQPTSTTLGSTSLVVSKTQARSTQLRLRDSNLSQANLMHNGKRWTWQECQPLSVKDKEQACARFLRMKSWLSEDSTESSWVTITSSKLMKWVLVTSRLSTSTTTTTWARLKLSSHSKSQQLVMLDSTQLYQLIGNTWLSINSKEGKDGPTRCMSSQTCELRSHLQFNNEKANQSLFYNKSI